MDELKKKTIAALEQQLQLLAQNGGSPAGKAETCNAITVLTALLHELRQVARELSADKLLWYIYDRCRVQAIFGAMEDGTARQARLRALYD